MVRSTWLHILIAAVGALAVLLFVRLHQARSHDAAVRTAARRAAPRCR
jgi:hypothetical protein